MPKKTVLVCDRCGFELTEKAEVDMALEGAEAWRSAAKGRGETPRGVYPCKNYVRCHGEMQLMKR